MPLNKLEQIAEYMLGASKETLGDMLLRFLEAEGADRKRISRDVEEWVEHRAFAIVAQFFRDHGEAWVIAISDPEKLGSIRRDLDVTDELHHAEPLAGTDNTEAIRSG